MAENINAELARVGRLRDGIEDELQGAIAALAKLAVDAGNDRARAKRLRQKGDGVAQVLERYGHKLKTVRRLDEANNLYSEIRTMGVLYPRNAFEIEGWQLAAGYIGRYLR